MRRLVSAVIVEAVYGHRIMSLEDPYVTLMDRAMEATTARTVSGSILDIFPVCEYQVSFSGQNERCDDTNPVKHVPAWMPGAGFMRDALRAKALVFEAHQVPYRMCRQNAVRRMPALCCVVLCFLRI